MMVSNLHKVFATALMCGAVGVAGWGHAATSAATPSVNQTSSTQSQQANNAQPPNNNAEEQGRHKQAYANAAHQRARLNAKEAQTTKKLNEQSLQKAERATSAANAQPSNQTALNAQPAAQRGYDQ
jgi:hypothetical protein